MKKLLLALASLAAVLLPEAALAQTFSQRPLFVQPQQWYDLGSSASGIEVAIVEGNAFVMSALAFATGSTSGSSTTLTLTAVPQVAPLVGALISGTGITAGTTVAAYTPGTAVITLSAAMTVAAGTAITYGTACPANGSPAPNQSGGMNIRAGTQGGLSNYPLYTTAKICVFGSYQGGAQLLTFPIGAW